MQIDILSRSISDHCAAFGLYLPFLFSVGLLVVTLIKGWPITRVVRCWTYGIIGMVILFLYVPYYIKPVLFPMINIPVIEGLVYLLHIPTVAYVLCQLVLISVIAVRYSTRPVPDCTIKCILLSVCLHYVYISHDVERYLSQWLSD